MENIERNADNRLSVSPTHTWKITPGISAFLRARKRLKRDSDLQKPYVLFLDSYEEMSHMTRLAVNQLTTNHYVIPHHCALKPDRRTTKHRVVFAASATTSSEKV